MFSLIVLGLASCNKDDVAPQDQGTGKVTIDFLGFDQATKTKASVADVKRPTTSWVGNVKDLMILFVSNDKVLDARSITLPTATDMASQKLTFDQVPAMTAGDIYIVANSGQTTNIARPNDAGGTWTPLTAKNQVFSKMYMKLVASDVTDAKLTDASKFKQPAEIFMAHQGNVNITADETTTVQTPLSLTRVVSLVRVRLNPIGDNKTYLHYDNAGCYVYLRKANPQFYLLNSVSKGHGDATGILFGGAFQSSNPTTGYTTTGEDIVDASHPYFQDFLSFPGGGQGSADRFEIVLKTFAKLGYHYPDGAAAKENDPVYFTGAFDNTAVANGILILNVTVSTQGTPTPPEPGSKFGKLSINVELKDWGSVDTGDITV